VESGVRHLKSAVGYLGRSEPCLTMPWQSAIKPGLVLGAEPARDGTAFLKTIAPTFLTVVGFAVMLHDLMPA